MAQTGGGETAAAVVDDHRAEDNLVAAVPVYVGHLVVVVALTVPGTAGTVAVPAPAFGQFMGGGVYVVGHHLVAGVDAAGQEDAGLAAVEIGGAEEVFRGAVAVAVAPGGVEVGLAGLQTAQRILHHLIGLAGEAVEVDEVLIALEDEPLAAAPGGVAVVLGGVADGLGGAVGHVEYSAVGGAHHTLGAAVAVPVVGHDVELVVLEVGHVRTGVNPPQAGAVEFQGFYHVVFAVVAAGQETLVGIAHVDALEQQLELAVAVEVGGAYVVGLETARQPFMGEGNLQVVLCPGGHGMAGSLLLPPHHGAHAVLAAGGAGGVGVVRHAERLAVHLHAVAVEVVGHVIILLAEDAPAAVYTAAGLHGHESAVQGVGGALGRCLRVGHGKRQAGHDEFLKHDVSLVFVVFVVLVVSPLFYCRVILRVVKCPSVWRARSMKMPWRTASGATWRPSVVK